MGGVVVNWRGFFCLGLSVFATVCLAQRALTVPDAKAHYVFEAIKHIEWPNEADLGPFVLGVVGDDPAMVEALNKRKLGAGRQIDFLIETFSDQSFNLGRYSALFISEKSIDLNPDLFSRAKNTLIISDGKVDRAHQMISLMEVGRRIKLQLNRKNINAKGFYVSINLLELGGTKGELSDQLRDEQVRLDKLMAKVDEREISLNRLNVTLKDYSLRLDTSRAALEKNEMAMEENEHSLEAQYLLYATAKETINKNKKEIEDQKAIIGRKRLEMVSQESTMRDLRSAIQKNEEILSSQMSEMDRQSVTIKNRDETITKQRNWIFLGILASLVYIVMIYFLVRLNKLHKQSSSELEAKNSQLFKLATTDGMTNLFNRRHFLEMAELEMLRQQRQVSDSVLLMMDIDHFKSINDRYGHAVGDEAIKAVAAVFTKSLRKYDLVGRVGGEEFVMLLVNCDIELATGIAQRLCELVADTPVDYLGLKISLTVSIGLSVIGQDDGSIEQVLLRADNALYQAKEGGRNRVVVYSE